ncbi:hypothetical protein WJX72_007496 [[Myrmecia] bisecta]|uniref:Uncharacterized protein n=1 Tax=[Myrmecia] bisecta TaxID=41462 RepID=A0AAW1QRE4_9CHLO
MNHPGVLFAVNDDEPVYRTSLNMTGNRVFKTFPGVSLVSASEFQGSCSLRSADTAPYAADASKRDDRR